MTKHVLFATAGALALALAGCGDAAEETTTEDTMMDGTAADQTSVATEGVAAEPGTAQHFVDSVAASDAYEIEAARLAQQNGTSEEVTSFAQMMIEDHTNSTNNLREAAAQATGVTLNPQMTPQQEQDLQALRDAGEAFDETYAQQQVAAHEAALSLLRDYTASGDVEALRSFARDTAGVVEGHLNEARELP
jgi:putative membrane protein